MCIELIYKAVCVLLIYIFLNGLALRFAFIWFVFLERTLILKLDYSFFFIIRPVVVSPWRKSEGDCAADISKSDSGFRLWRPQK